MKLPIRMTFYFFLATLVSCTQSEEESRLDVDVSGIDVSIETVRVEQELFRSDTSEMKEVNSDLVKSLGSFYDFYMLEVIHAGSAYDPMAVDNLKDIVTDSTIQRIYKEVNRKFGDFSKFEGEIKEAFKHLRYYYPDAYIPKLATLVTPFMYRTIPTDSVLGLGLEMYLGSDNELVKSIPPQMMPQYIKEGMKPEYITVDAARAWLETHYAPKKGETFLSALLYEGKILYAVDAMMPNAPDHIKIRYSEVDWEWCVDNEANIWHEIVDQKWLYKKDKMLINKMVGEAPFTAVLPKESPARAGAWMGWMMVRQYMDRNPELTVVDLLKTTLNEDQKILKGYNPE